jgi:hypothetical protein
VGMNMVSGKVRMIEDKQRRVRGASADVVSNGISGEREAVCS